VHCGCRDAADRDPGKEPRRIGPGWSPDSRWLAFKSTLSGSSSQERKTDVNLVDVASGRSELLTPGDEQKIKGGISSVSGLLWTEDSRGFLLADDYHGRVWHFFTDGAPAQRIAALDGKTVQLIAGPGNQLPCCMTRAKGVAVCRHDGFGYRSVGVIALRLADGVKIRSFTADESHEQFSWASARNAEKIVYLRETGEDLPALWILDTLQNKRRRW